MSLVPKSKNHREESFTFASQKDTMYWGYSQQKNLKDLDEQKVFREQGEENNCMHMLQLIIKKYMFIINKQFIERQKTDSTQNNKSPPGALTLVKVEQTNFSLFFPMSTAKNPNIKYEIKKYTLKGGEKAGQSRTWGPKEGHMVCSLGYFSFSYAPN